MKELLLFQVGKFQLGMDLSFVRSIQSVSGIASKEVEKHEQFSPLTTDHDISTYNLPAILEDESSSNNLENQKLIVVNTQDRPVGLIVERVHRVVKSDIDMIEPLSPIFQGLALSCFPRVLKHEGRLVLLMFPQGMVNILRHMQENQALSERLNPKTKEKSRLEVKSADTVIAEMIMKSQQNMMEWEGSQNPI